MGEGITSYDSFARYFMRTDEPRLTMYIANKTSPAVAEKADRAALSGIAVVSRRGNVKLGNLG